MASICRIFTAEFRVDRSYTFPAAEDKFCIEPVLEAQEDYPQVMCDTALL